MKKTLILSALIFSAAGVKAQDFLPEGLPGLSDDPAQAGIQRPDAKRIISELSPALRLSSKQEDRIGGAITKKSKEFDKLLKEYDKAAAEEKRCREKVETLKSRMRNINKSIPDVIKDQLDDEQIQNFNDILEARKKRAGAENPAGAEIKEGGRPAGAGPAKKKKLIRKKKKRPAAGRSADQDADPAEAAVGAAGSVSAPEEEPGTTMVDSEQSAEPRLPARKKKKVLKKKARPAAPVEAPAEDAAEDEPAGAAATGREVPEEAPADEGVGSYP